MARPRRTTDENRNKQRNLMPSSAHLAPGSPEYDRIFKGVQPPVLDDGTPKNTKILEEWRSYVLYHYLKHWEAEETMRINSKTKIGKYYARPILGRPGVFAPQLTADLQGDIVMKVDSQAAGAVPSTTTTPEELIMESPVIGRNDSLLALEENSIWTRESKRISRAMTSSRLARLPCKVRRKHVSVLDDLGTGRGCETQNL